MNVDEAKNEIPMDRSVEITYGIRNFIGNSVKFSKSKINVDLETDSKKVKISISDDGPGFPKDLIDKQRLGEPYIRSANEKYISKHGLGLGTFIGKTLLEKNFAIINFKNSSLNGGAEVNIKWKNKDLKKKI